MISPGTLNEAARAPAWGGLFREEGPATEAGPSERIIPGTPEYSYQVQGLVEGKIIHRDFVKMLSSQSLSAHVTFTDVLATVLQGLSGKLFLGRKV